VIGRLVYFVGVEIAYSTFQAVGFSLKDTCIVSYNSFLDLGYMIRTAFYKQTSDFMERSSSSKALSMALDRSNVFGEKVFEP